MTETSGRPMTRADGSWIRYFGTGPRDDARPPCLVVIGDSDELVRKLGASLPPEPVPVVVLAGSLNASPAESAGSIGSVFCGPPLDQDVWALIRARYCVVTLIAIWMEGAGITMAGGLPAVVERGTPAVVAIPDGIAGSPGEVPPGMIVIRHPGREGVIGMSDRATWLEGYACTGVVPKDARKQAFIHVDDLLSTCRAAVEALQAGPAGVWSVGPCPVFDPNQVRTPGDIPPVTAVCAPSGPLPKARPPSDLWDAAGTAEWGRGR